MCFILPFLPFSSDVCLKIYSLIWCHWRLIFQLNLIKTDDLWHQKIKLALVSSSFHPFWFWSNLWSSWSVWDFSQGKTHDCSICLTESKHLNFHSCSITLISLDTDWYLSFCSLSLSTQTQKSCFPCFLWLKLAQLWFTWRISSQVNWSTCRFSSPENLISCLTP